MTVYRQRVWAQYFTNKVKDKKTSGRKSYLQFASFTSQVWTLIKGRMIPQLLGLVSVKYFGTIRTIVSVKTTKQ